MSLARYTLRANFRKLATVKIRPIFRSQLRQPYSIYKQQQPTNSSSLTPINLDTSIPHNSTPSAPHVNLRSQINTKFSRRIPKISKGYYATLGALFATVTTAVYFRNQDELEQEYQKYKRDMIKEYVGCVTAWDEYKMRKLEKKKLKELRQEQDKKAIAEAKIKLAQQEAQQSVLDELAKKKEIEDLAVFKEELEVIKRKQKEDDAKEHVALAKEQLAVAERELARVLGESENVKTSDNLSIYTIILKVGDGKLEEVNNTTSNGESEEKHRRKSEESNGCP